MVVLNDASELKIIVRCVVVACKEALTIDELWKRVQYVLGGAHCVQLSIFGCDTVFDYLKSISDVVQLEDPNDTNSLVSLVSSELSRHMEILVTTNIYRPPSTKNKAANKELLIPYRIQCAFIRVIVELYPEGLSICDFESTVLNFPIFNSFINNVELLLWNLDHIFKYKGSETVILRSTVANSIKEIVEEDKFNAEDIFNIDELSLENKTNDKSIAHVLEYPLFYVLEEPIKNNIELLLDEHEWISERKICDLYNEKFGSSFCHFRRWGFSRVSQLFAKLPELCCVNFLDNDVEIISVKKYSKYSCEVEDLVDKINSINNVDLELSSTSIKKKSEKECEQNYGKLKAFLRDDTFLEASLDDCFLEQEIQHIDLQINQLLSVKVCRVNIGVIPSIICQILEESDKLQNLLIDMKRFYFMNESKFVFDSSLIVNKYIYAYCLDDIWYRGFVFDVDSSSLKMTNLDNGLIHNVPFDEIRILYKGFSQLPPQSLTCHLHGIDFVDEDVLSELVDKKCIINIVSINQRNKSASVQIKLMNSSSNEYLNDEWIKNGSADPES